MLSKNSDKKSADEISKIGGERSPIHWPHGNDLVNWLEDELPPHAVCHLDAGLRGDVDAASSLSLSAPNEWRGIVAMAAYYIGTPNPAYRTIVQNVWEHDHHHLIGAANRKISVVRHIFKEAQFRPDLVGATRIYRGVSGLTLGQAERGISWTLSRDVAGWFAYRFASGMRKPLLITAIVDAKDIIFLSNDRAEQEVILARNPAAVIDPILSDWQSCQQNFQDQMNERHDKIMAKFKSVNAAA